MIKINSNSIGNIFVKKDVLKNSINKIIFDWTTKSKLKNITFDLKKGSLKFVNIFFKKELDIEYHDEQNLCSEIQFFLSSKFQLNNVMVVFWYE